MISRQRGKRRKRESSKQPSFWLILVIFSLFFVVYFVRVTWDAFCTRHYNFGNEHSYNRCFLHIIHLCTTDALKIRGTLRSSHRFGLFCVFWQLTDLSNNKKRSNKKLVIFGFGLCPRLHVVTCLVYGFAASINNNNLKNKLKDDKIYIYKVLERNNPTESVGGERKSTTRTIFYD